MNTHQTYWISKLQQGGFVVSRGGVQFGDCSTALLATHDINLALDFIRECFLEDGKNEPK